MSATTIILAFLLYDNLTVEYYQAGWQMALQTFLAYSNVCIIKEIWDV